MHVGLKIIKINKQEGQITWTPVVQGMFYIFVIILYLFWLLYFYISCFVNVRSAVGRRKIIIIIVLIPGPERQAESAR